MARIVSRASCGETAPEPRSSRYAPTTAGGRYRSAGSVESWESVSRSTAEVSRLEGDRGLPAAGLDQGLLDRSARLVLDVEDARNRVRALERPVEARALAVEGHGELLDEQRAHEVRAFPRNQHHGVWPAQAVAGALDVRGEGLGRIPFGPGHDAALRVVGVRLLRLGGACHERDGHALARRRERGRAAGDPGTENEDVGAAAARCHAGEISREISAAQTECVSAPTEIASAPASA